MRAIRRPGPSWDALYRFWQETPAGIAPTSTRSAIRGGRLGHMSPAVRTIASAALRSVVLILIATLLVFALLPVALGAVGT